MELTLNAAHGDQTLCGQIVNGNNNSVSGQLSVDNRADLLPTPARDPANDTRMWTHAFSCFT
jgi:hypothetical protein